MQCNGGRVGRSYHVYNEHNWEDLEWHKRQTCFYTPPGHIKRQHCKSKEALFCNIFDFFFWIVCTLSIFRPVILHASLGWSLLKTSVLVKDCCYKEKTLRMLDGGYGRNWRGLIEQRNPCSRTDCKYCQRRFYFQRQRSIFKYFFHFNRW